MAIFCFILRRCSDFCLSRFLAPIRDTVFSAELRAYGVNLPSPPPLWSKTLKVIHHNFLLIALLKNKRKVKFWYLSSFNCCCGNRKWPPEKVKKREIVIFDQSWAFGRNTDRLSALLNKKKLYVFWCCDSSYHLLDIVLVFAYTRCLLFFQ